MVMACLEYGSVVMRRLVASLVTVEQTIGF